MGTRALWIRPNITFACNRHCAFCFAKEAEHPVLTMDEVVIDRLLEIYKRHIKNQGGQSPYTSLLILGGEPLMVPDMCQYLIKGFREISPQMYVRIATNGDLMNDEIVPWCEELKVVMHLSANNTPIPVIEEQIKFLQRTRIPIEPCVALTMHNMRRVKDLLALYHKYSCYRVRLRHLFGRADQKYLDLYHKTIPEALQWVLEDKEVPPRKLEHTCGTRYFIIDPNGDVGWCCSRIKLIANNWKIGSIWDDDFDFLEAMNRHNHPIHDYKGIPECEKCDFRTTCGSGCPLQKIVRYGRIDLPSPYCRSYKKTVPLLIEMKKRWNERHTFESSMGIIYTGSPEVPE